MASYFAWNRRPASKADRKDHRYAIGKKRYYQRDAAEQAVLVEEPVDMIIGTHPYASTILAEMISDMGLDIPVFYYATDVFNVPVASIDNKLAGFFISTKEGRERAIEKGQRDDLVLLASFPLQKELLESVHLTKREAREKLGLDPDLFTIQLNLGGEGIGSIKVIEGLDKAGVKAQIIILGGLNKQTKKQLERVSKRTNPNLHVIVRGFVSNVSDYLFASDVIVGRAGINTIVESIFAKRPFLITELVYTVIPSADYIEKYGVGWNADDEPQKAVNILKDLIDNPQKLSDIDLNFKKVPITYGADDIANRILDIVKAHQ